MFLTPIEAAFREIKDTLYPELDGETGNGGTSAQTGQARAKKGRTGAGRSIKVKPEAEKTMDGSTYCMDNSVVICSRFHESGIRFQFQDDSGKK